MKPGRIIDDVLRYKAAKAFGMPRELLPNKEGFYYGGARAQPRMNLSFYLLLKETEEKKMVGVK